MSRTKSLFDKSICARIKDLRLNLDLTGVKFAFNIGISQGFLSDVENCKAGPSKTLLIAISYVYNVNMGWLLTGEGQMTRGPELESDELVLHMDRGDPIRRHTQDANLPMEAITKEQAEARKAEKGGDDASILYKEEDTDPEVADLVLKTRQILTSGTGYSASLAANIRSFHNAMTTEAHLHRMDSDMSSIKTLVNDLVNECREIKERLKKSDSNIRQEDPEAVRGEILKKRAV